MFLAERGVPGPHSLQMDGWQTYKTNRWFLGVIKQMMMRIRMMRRKSREKEPKEGKEEEDCPTGVSSTIL